MQVSQRRPFNCAAAFELPGSSDNVSSSADAYLYSDPEMLGTGWQDSSSGRRNQYNDTNSTTSAEQTSSVAVVSGPVASASVKSIKKDIKLVMCCVLICVFSSSIVSVNLCFILSSQRRLMVIDNANKF
ncbi:unnamed protein product [Taenia asiatica]|uniref:Uncharacterized protein n=1 Tax=Taenia asiatica TaxID=60517 RepID=A0A3P6S5Y6_TAEAS|nr:unnamed protein product [Taenia asiatica]